MTDTQPTPLRQRLLPLGASALVFILSLPIHRQGLNLMDDGLWLLGARVLADGGHLYRDLFSIYGPARYSLLVPLFWIFGPSALALAVLKALADAACAGFGFWLTRKLGARRWAWIVPVGVMAFGPVYPRYLAAGLFAGLVCGAVPLGSKARRGWLLGLGWGLLSLFGLDMWAYGAAILGLSWLFDRESLPVPVWPSLGLAMGAVLGLASLVPLFGGYGGTVWWDTVVYPATRFGGAMGQSWWQTFLHSPQLTEPFAGLNTGESLPALWPGHEYWLSWAWRGLYVLAWLTPLLAAWLVRRRGWPGMAALVGLGCAGWSALLGRGDLDHLRLISWGLLVLGAPLLGRTLAGHRKAAVGLIVCLLLVLGPRLTERLWLVGNAGRAGLQTWVEPTAGIKLGAERMKNLDEILAGLKGRPETSLVAWPAQPGLVFLAGAALGTPQMTLLAGEVRDPAALIAKLAADPPGTVLLGRSAGLVAGVRQLQTLAPELYSFLRRNYRLAASLETAEGVFRLLYHEAGGIKTLRNLPVKDRLAGDSQYVRSGTTPPLGPGSSVAQSVRVADFDLAGLSLMIASPGPWPQEITLGLQVVGVTDGRADKLLAQIPLSATVNKAREKVVLSFAPVSGSRGRTVILDIQGNPTGENPFALYWNVPAETSGAAVDFYPEGQAFWNKKPVGGDLFFAVH